MGRCMPPTLTCGETNGPAHSHAIPTFGEPLQQNGPVPASSAYREAHLPMPNTAFNLLFTASLLNTDAYQNLPTFKESLQHKAQRQK